MSDKQKPEDTLRQGPLKASIWKNDTDNGPKFNTTLARVYRDAQGQWHETQSFRSSDLLGVAELGRAAHHRVNELKQEHYRSQGADRAEHKAKRQAQRQSRDQGHSQQR